MTDTARLEIQILSSQVQQANNRLNALERQGGRAQRATDGLTSSFMRLAGPVASVATAMTALNKLVNVAREFDKLNAGLITATGSSEDAAKAFEALVEFASTTPYDLNQAVEGFTKLVNLGLTPSEEALRSYGNTASAMGKDLNQMIEAVADAATGEFERLKEFGIKASSEGDRVSLTFQGVTTNIGKNAAEIEQYLMAIGNNEFAGAMQRRAESLDGALSNLGDTWDSLFRAIAAAGAGELIADQVRLATAGLEELIAMVQSGQLEAELDAIAMKFSSWSEDIDFTLQYISGAFDSETDYWSSLVTDTVGFLVDAFKNFPENVRAFIQLMTVEVAAGFDKAEALAVSFKDAVKAVFTDDTQDQVNARYQAALERIDGVRMDMIGTILAERDADVQAYADRQAAAKALREEYDKEREARKANTEDRLAQYALDKGKPGSKASDGVDKASAAAEKKRQADYEKLVEDLLTEEEALKASYERRKAIIEGSTTSESAARADLMSRLDEQYQKEYDQLMGIEDMYTRRQRLAKSVAAIEEAGWTDAQKAAAEYQAQMETLWEAQMVGVISAEQHEQAVAKVTEAYEKQQAKATSAYIDLEELGKQAARNIQDAFADFLFDPFDKGLDGMLQGFVTVVQRMAAEAAAAQLTSALFGSMGGGSGSGWLGAIASGVGAMFGGGGAAASSAMGASTAGYTNYDLSGFVPGRAAGGPTVGRKLYEVNERGPEMYSENGRNYLLSNSGGNVTPLKEGGGASADGQINLTMIFQVDNTGADVGASVEGDAGSDMTQFMETMKNVSMQTMQSEMRPGGLLWKIREGRAR